MKQSLLKYILCLISPERGFVHLGFQILISLTLFFKVRTLKAEIDDKEEILMLKKEEITQLQNQIQTSVSITACSRNSLLF